MTPSDWRTQPEPDERVCPKCGSTELESIEPPQGDPHRRWFCAPCNFATTGSKAEARRFAEARLVEAAERSDKQSALARHREEQR